MNFSDLNEKQKEYVFNRSKTELLEKIISGELRFNDMLNGDDLQKKIDVAIGKAENARYAASALIVTAAWGSGSASNAQSAAGVLHAAWPVKADEGSGSPSTSLARLAHKVASEPVIGKARISCRASVPKPMNRWKRMALRKFSASGRSNSPIKPAMASAIC